MNRLEAIAARERAMLPGNKIRSGELLLAVVGVFAAYDIKGLRSFEAWLRENLRPPVEADMMAKLILALEPLLEEDQ